MDYALVAAVVLLAAFTQGVTGFGSALVAMPLLTPFLGTGRAAALMALVAAAQQTVLIWRYRRSVHWGVTWRLSAAALVATPAGVYAIRFLDERITLSLLAALLVGYALYGLTRPALPRVRHPGWLYTAGLTAGFLGGAYNTNGPPVVIYGNSRGWSPLEFKGTLQVFFALNGAAILASHFVGGNVTRGVWTYLLWSLPAMAVGTAAGLALDRHINEALFRRIVLVLLLVLGARLAVRVIAGV